MYTNAFGLYGLDGRVRHNCRFGVHTHLCGERACRMVCVAFGERYTTKKTKKRKNTNK